MGYNFIECERDQIFMMPPDMREWLPESHPVWFLIETVRGMDTSAFYSAYRQDGKGGAAFDPDMMVALVLFSYMHGLRSSRKIEEACTLNVAFRVLCGNQVPDHSTISRFRKRNARNLDVLFAESVRLCGEAGLVDSSLIAVDGTKIHASASMDKNRSLGWYREDFQRWLRECDEVDAAEDELYGEDRRGDELPDAINTHEKRRKFIEDHFRRREQEAERAAGEQAEKIARREAEERDTGKKKRGRKLKSPEKVRSEVERNARVNTTDPDSRMMKGSKGFLQGYNAQVAVTGGQIIVAADLTNREADWDLLCPTVQKARENLERAGVEGAIESVVADAGYASDSNLKKTEEEPCEFFIATKKDRIQAREMKETPAVEGPPTEGLTPRQRMEHKLKTENGRETFKKRGQTVEPVFGQMKDWLGFDRCMMRGLEACSGEWQLMAAVHNLWKLFRHSVVPAAT